MSVTRSLVRSLRVAFALGGVSIVIACSGAPNDARIGIEGPDRAQFDSVGPYLIHRCGSLDCHGTRQRNLQMWGTEAMRLDPKDNSGIDGKDTTPAELDATYRSLVALEPAVMSAVVHGKGREPNMLTFVRKARGTESHKGGALVAPGDDQDKCIASWLQSAVDAAACERALAGW